MKKSIKYCLFSLFLFCVCLIINVFGLIFYTFENILEILFIFSVINLYLSVIYFVYMLIHNVSNEYTKNILESNPGQFCGKKINKNKTLNLVFESLPFLFLGGFGILCSLIGLILS